MRNKYVVLYIIYETETSLVPYISTIHGCCTTIQHTSMILIEVMYLGKHCKRRQADKIDLIAICKPIMYDLLRIDLADYLSKCVCEANVP